MSDDFPERRAQQITATVLFADVVGFERLERRRGTESAYLSVTHLMRQLDAIARKHGGSVDKYLGDKLMAVFGHPLPLQQPEAAACRAALEIRDHVDQYDREAGPTEPLAVHVGINTGPLVSGDIRGPVVREFHVLGDAVNVAARINARTPPGEIWVGDSVQSATAGAFAWKPLGPMELKGKRNVVHAFALEAALVGELEGDLGDAERPVAALFGRETELQWLRERLVALTRGAGGVVQLVGPPGAGKSRLLAALGESEEAAAATVLRLTAHPGDRDRPLSVLAPLVGGEAADAAARVRDALSARSDGRALLLVIEDADVADGASLEAAREAVAHPGAPPALLVLCRREGLEAAGVETLELGPLAADGARALARAALGDSADEETLALVLERGGALPGPLLQACFLAPALRSEREQAATLQARTAEAERRTAAVVFADISGFTAMTERVGAERAYPVVAACLDLLDAAARRHGGTVDHYLGDCAMALFGIPHAIEDAPRAALNAAIDMRRGIRDFNATHELPLPIDVHCGVATGTGIAGDVSGPMIREFVVMGAHVDRADALTHAAGSGEVLLDDATYQATRTAFEFAPDAARLLPGAAFEQATWQLRSETPSLYRDQVGTGRQVFSELVGREQPLAALREALVGVQAGRGGIVSLSAEAGIGKSRLLAEVSGSAEAEGVTWLVGRSLSNGRSLRYHPVSDLLRAWAEITDDDGAAGARRKLDRLVGALVPEERDTKVWLANLSGLPLDAEEEGHLEAIHGEAAEKLVRAAFVRLLRALCERGPVAVVMEDLHWADLSTVELLESVLGLSAEQPLLFIDAFRPGFADTSGRVLETARARHAERHAELELEPLDDGAARAMVKNLFRGGDVPRETRNAIEERAHGNPFYIEEVVRTLVDAGAVEIRDGRFHATERLASVTIPHTVQEAVMARVDRLDLRRKAVLQAASVVGGTFHVDVLEELSPGTELAAALHDLEAGEFIVPSDRTAGEEFAFKHPLIQEVTYDSLLEARRQELHRRVAVATEKRLPDSLPGYDAMLAYHFGKARDAERAEVYLFRAGDEAARAAASNEALYFFRQASALYDELNPGGGDPDKRARLEKSLGMALLNRGQLIAAVDHFDATARLLGRSAPRAPVAMGLSFASDLSRLLARLYLGRPYGRRPAGERDRELIDVMFRRAIAESTTDPTRFLVDATALVRTTVSFDPLTVPESAAILSGLVAIFSLGGISFRTSRRVLDVAAELVRAGAVNERELYYLTLRFLHFLLAGDWSEEHTIPGEVVEQGIRDGRFWEASTYLDLDCQRRLYQGNFEAVGDRIAQLASLVDLYDNELASSAQRAHTAFLHVERRDFEAAERAIELYYDEHAEVLFNVVALGTRARSRALEGRLDEADEALRRAGALMDRAGRAPPLHASYVHSARYLVDVMKLEESRSDAPSRAARRRLQRSRRAAAASGRHVAWRRTEALRLAGREAWALGDRKQALQWWTRALACADGLGARPERARTLADAGRALARTPGVGRLGGRDADQCLEEARASFAELGLERERDQLGDPG